MALSSVVPRGAGSWDSGASFRGSQSSVCPAHLQAGALGLTPNNFALKPEDVAQSGEHFSAVCVESGTGMSLDSKRRGRWFEPNHPHGAEVQRSIAVLAERLED